MKASILLSILALSVLTVGCGPQKSTVQAKYAKNAFGATAIDPNKTMIAGEEALNQGVQVDILDIRKEVGPSGETVIRSILALNDGQRAVTTSHMTTEIREGCIDMSGFAVVFHGMCSGTQCSAYFAGAEVYANTCKALINDSASAGQFLTVQLGVKKDFTNKNNDRYQLFTPSAAKAFINLQNPTDTSSLVGYLSQ